ncbi:MAG: hypothetical protein SD837_06100 [Candidatus Electrothrix scaldis]|nr:MAG: hypothetical protein SD837_06100 [Candidatus Electrothrix sp. GW3-3]
MGDLRMKMQEPVFRVPYRVIYGARLGFHGATLQVKVMQWLTLAMLSF